MAGLWLADASPASAHAENDEFADNSGGVPSGWTEYDHGSVATVSEDEQGLVITVANQAAVAHTGIYKAIPAGDFTIWSKVHISGPAHLINAPSLSAGLALFEDASLSTGDVRTYGISAETTPLMVVRSMTDYGYGGGAVMSSHETKLRTDTYLRISRTGTTYTFFTSDDGTSWQRSFSTAALGITPTHFGPYFLGVNAGITTSARFSFFRYVASDLGMNGYTQGDRVTFTVQGGSPPGGGGKKSPPGGGGKRDRKVLRKVRTLDSVL